jgi:hypothetical protein
MKALKYLVFIVLVSASYAVWAHDGLDNINTWREQVRSLCVGAFKLNEQCKRFIQALNSKANPTDPVILANCRRIRTSLLQRLNVYLQQFSQLKPFYLVHEALLSDAETLASEVMFSCLKNAENLLVSIPSEEEVKQYYDKGCECSEANYLL